MGPQPYHFPHKKKPSDGYILIITFIQTFFSRFETLLRYVKPEFINPSLLDELNIPLEKVLEDEAAGLAFPLDAKYFDQFPLVSNDDIPDIAGRRYPKSEHESLKQLVLAKKYLDCKTFPHLQPHSSMLCVCVRE